MPLVIPVHAMYPGFTVALIRFPQKVIMTSNSGLDKVMTSINLLDVQRIECNCTMFVTESLGYVYGI